MISAIELLTYQKSHRKTQIENELLSLEEKFKEAAESGISCVRLPIVYQENIDVLKELGYRITKRNKLDQCELVIIFWGERVDD